MVGIFQYIIRRKKCKFLTKRICKKNHNILGVLEAEFEENEVHVIPITYPFATSHIWWPIDQAKEFNIKFDFRSTRTNAVLAYTDVITKDGNGFWEVSLRPLTCIAIDRFL